MSSETTPRPHASVSEEDNEAKNGGRRVENDGDTSIALFDLFRLPQCTAADVKRCIEEKADVLRPNQIGETVLQAFFNRANAASDFDTVRTLLTPRHRYG